VGNAAIGGAILVRVGDVSGDWQQIQDVTETKAQLNELKEIIQVPYLRGGGPESSYSQGH
jgi:hypothetical protein